MTTTILASFTPPLCHDDAMLSAAISPKAVLRNQDLASQSTDDSQPKISRQKGLQPKAAAELDALLPSILDKAFKGEL